jgi:hypothetical protein
MVRRRTVRNFGKPRTPPYSSSPSFPPPLGGGSGELIEMRGQEHNISTNGHPSSDKNTQLANANGHSLKCFSSPPPRRFRELWSNGRRNTRKLGSGSAGHLNLRSRMVQRPRYHHSNPLRMRFVTLLYQTPFLVRIRICRRDSVANAAGGFRNLEE